MQRSLALAAFTMVLWACSSQPVFAQLSRDSRDPAELLPGNATFYLQVAGGLDHEEALQQTAAYAALYSSGLMEAFDGLLQEFDNHDRTFGLNDAILHVRQYGFSLAFAVDGPDPGPLAGWGTIVVPEAGDGVELLVKLIEALDAPDVEVLTSRVRGRKVSYVKIPNAPAELGWWKEGNHLVIGLGMNGIASTMAVADGKRPNLTTHPLFSRYSEIDGEFDITQRAWFDFKSLREMFGSVPVPVEGQEKPVELARFLEALGLHTLEHVALFSGYRGESLWGELVLEAPGERTGLLALLDQPTFQLAELPAMPLEHLGISVSSCDWGSAWDTLLDVARSLSSLGLQDFGEKCDVALHRFENELGFTPDELFHSLGHLNCAYADAAQGEFGLGSVLMLQVQDAPKLKYCLEKIFSRLKEEADGKEKGLLQIRQSETDAGTVYRLEVTKFPLLQPTFEVSEEWLTIGLIPQAVTAQRLRMDGILFSWSIADDLTNALELLPSEMTSLQVVDPAPSYRTLLGLAPSLVGFIELGLRENGALPRQGHLPIEMSAIPPAEAVTMPLFFNVSVTTVDEQGLQVYSRQSLPALPLFGSMTGLTTASTLIAVGIPAFQARSAKAEAIQPDVQTPAATEQPAQ